jgi:carbohydrate-selective porin OprB
MVTPAIFVQPDLQYIINPGGDASVDNALVGGVRIGIAF